MKCFILHLPLFIFFLAGSARADGGDVLDRIVRLPGMKGTVYALLGTVSELSGYLFIYDSQVIHNDSVVSFPVHDTQLTTPTNYSETPPLVTLSHTNN